MPVGRAGDSSVRAAQLSFCLSLRWSSAPTQRVPSAAYVCAQTQGIKPLDILADGSSRAKWANEGLPIDPLSVENGAIMNSASRWSLMIDPQLQARCHGSYALHEIHAPFKAYASEVE